MNVWHPFTQEKTAKTPIKITSGKGSYLYTADDKKYLDAISSWWVNLHGHANQEIADAIYEQAKTLEHVIFAGFSHDPAYKLCSELQKLLPEELNRFFFSDNGSTAVEVSLKMAYQYFKNIGIENRNIFINLEGGYHGDTLGAMSASGQTSIYHSTFAEFFFKTFSINIPEYYEGVENIEEKEEHSIEKLKDFLKSKGERVCALLIEPLVQGAAGMRMYREEFLNRICEEVRKYEILVIFDEVMTGFYRTGTTFAMNQTQIIPDFLCISKGITGGFLPLSLTITTNKIYQAFLSDDWKKAFLHGHSYTANPIACAAALKSLEILQRPETQQNINDLRDVHKLSMTNIKHFSKIRYKGTIAAFEVESSHIAKLIADKMFENGIIIRPINNIIYIIPPYCTKIEDLKELYNTLLDKCC